MGQFAPLLLRFAAPPDAPYDPPHSGASSSSLPSLSPPDLSVARLRQEGSEPELLLVAVHGWLLSGRLWEPLVQAMGPHHSLWCPDLPGFGTMPRPRGMQPSLASYGRWLAEAVRQQHPHRPVVLLGHSLGGSIALHAAPALGGQLRGIVQIAAGGGVYQPRAFARLRQGGTAFLRWRPGWLAAWPGTLAIRSPLQAERRAAQGLLACSTNRGAVRQLPRLVADLSVPSLWIVGSRDGVMQPRYVRHLAGYCPAPRVELLEGAGHLPMREQPQQLAQHIEAWLQQEVLPPQPQTALIASS